ncbi:MAG: 16S rRNA (guanine(527)-N(7))-methyltransferase RsmG [Pseudomonadota bacterium]
MQASHQPNLSADLAKGVTALGLDLDAAKQEQMLALINELLKWNRAYNLTAIKAPDAMLRKHLLDSLSIQPFLRGSRLLDVGTGAGFPGLPLAIVEPAREWILLDSNAKKLRFIDHVAATLGIHNVQTAHARIEQFSTTDAFDTIVCRAFSSLGDYVDRVSPLLDSDGVILAMKGRQDYEEYSPLADNWRLETHTLVVPLLAEERHIVELHRLT